MISCSDSLQLISSTSIWYLSLGKRPVDLVVSNSLSFTNPVKSLLQVEWGISHNPPSISEFGSERYFIIFKNFFVGFVFGVALCFKPSTASSHLGAFMLIFGGKLLSWDAIWLANRMADEEARRSWLVCHWSYYHALFKAVN